jgi:glycogen operon protein
MICGGDENGRTKKGNNNTYCQDNELTWHSWNLTEEQERLFEFTCKLIAFRNEHPIFHRPKFFQGKKVLEDLKDINWLRPDGAEMDGGDWGNTGTRAFGILLCGDDMNVTTFEGQTISDDTFYLCFNAYHEKLPFVMPGKDDVSWQLILNTAEPDGFVEDAEGLPAGAEFGTEGRSFCLFKQTHGSDETVKAGAKDKTRQVAEARAKIEADRKQAEEAAAQAKETPRPEGAPPSPTESPEQAPAKEPKRRPRKPKA